MNKIYFNFTILISAFILILQDTSVFNNHKAMAAQRYVLEDRKIRSLCILPFKAKEIELGLNITEKFFITLKNNFSSVRVLNSEITENCDGILSGELKNYTSETKTNTISDALSYDVVEQQIKVAIEIEIKESKTKDILWRRMATGYKAQSWIEFTRARIADNNLLSFFSVPNQLATSIKKQYNEKEFIDMTINDVVLDLSTNLVKLK